jgi:Icc-related predicted phosphoesterase
VAAINEHLSRILCAGEPRGSAAAVDRAVRAAEEQHAQAIIMIGDLAGDNGTAGLRAVFKALGRMQRPCYWVPGPGDAPIGEYLREAQNFEIVFPMLRGVHGTAAYEGGGHVVFAGHGGEIVDTPDAHDREEEERLRYPRWEPEYRLKVLGELSEHQLVLVFASPPAHKGRGEPGSEAVTELIGTHRPRLAVVGGDRRSEHIGRSLVVAPGRLSDGQCTMVDLHAHTAEPLELAAAPT